MQPGVMPQLAPDDLSGVRVFEGVQGWPISSLILKDILAYLCETVQSWLPQANVRY